MRDGTFHIPFNVDVAHVFSSDASFIQSDITCVPNDSSQEVPVSSMQLYFTPWCITLRYMIILQRVSYFLALRGVISHGGPGKPSLLGKMSTHI